MALINELASADREKICISAMQKGKSSSGLLINYVIFNFTISFTFKIMMAQYFFYFFISVKSPYILVLLLILIDSYIQIKSFVLQENGSSSA